MNARYGPLPLCLLMVLPVMAVSMPSTDALAGMEPAALAQMQEHLHHDHPPSGPLGEPPAKEDSGSPEDHEDHQDHDHSTHEHDVGPAGATYDLRFIDAMVQHHTGALRMSEFVFDIGAPGVGSLAKAIWRDQAQEIRAMGLWRKRWYPQAPVFPVVLAPGGDPDALSGLTRMSAEQIAAMRMVGDPPTRKERVVWFLEGMLAHHGMALQMAHDALAKSTNPTVRRFARQVIVAQRWEIIQLRRMLALEGLQKPEYGRFDRWFRF